jgi:uncharacterized protein YciI
MQFVLIAYDGTDPGAQARRMMVREKHLEGAEKLKESGNLIWGGAILDEQHNMTGSVVVYEYESREKLDEMLREEPYITGDVWQKIDIQLFKLANI